MKRVVDILLACMLLLVALPLALLVATAIMIRMGRPVLFRQLRTGYLEQPFTLYKFRTMTNDTDADGNLLPNEDRLVRLGQILRALSLDELPQLINVLRGDISLIGPRPLLNDYVPLYSDRQRQRHAVLPGITGWAQVNGRNSVSWPERLEMDVWYVENWTPWLDFKIVVMTVMTVIGRRGVNNAEGQIMERFKGET